MAYVNENPGASTRRIRENVTGGAQPIAAMLEELIDDGSIRVEYGPNKAVKHYPVSGTTQNHWDSDHDD
jgi:hypothetical protein